LRITVISPFIDKKHGTERCVAEVIERLAHDYGCEIHLYAQHVDDLALESMAAPRPEAGFVRWHRVMSIPGPHLLQYVWWFGANTFLRWWDARRGKVCSELLFSPGINAWDAEVIQVHIVFEAFYQQVKSQLRFRASPFSSWPLLIHRRLYYGLIRWLEGQIYPRKQVHLAAVSGLVRTQLDAHYQRPDAHCVRNGVDLKQFAPELRLQRRSQARADLEIIADRFVFLLIGNDWRKKGLQTAIEALGKCMEMPIQLLVVGRDDAEPFVPTIRRLNLSERIKFLRPSDDVMKFYAAADAYLGPSLEDAFGLPILEAMACGLPVIASVNAGASEIIEDRSSGLLLRDPANVTELTALIQALVSHPSLRELIAENASKTAGRYTWADSADALWKLLTQVVAEKRSHS
jgi:glycosyltransferase involved in cell wall biosynthesis